MSRSGRVRDKVPMFKGHSVRKEVCSEDEEIRTQLEEDELFWEEENKALEDYFRDEGD
jgi:hypothetical protein